MTITVIKKLINHKGLGFDLSVGLSKGIMYKLC